MGAGQSADTTTPGKLQTAARRAFFKEHGRDPTKEEEERFTTAFERDDPTDTHLGPVEAEEADALRDTGSELIRAGAGREPTDDELSRFTEKLARAFRRAALEAVSDIETARRELVRRAVEAERTRDPFVVLRRVEAERRESERRIEPPPAPARAKASGDAAAPSRVVFGPLERLHIRLDHGFKHGNHSDNDSQHFSFDFPELYAIAVG